MNPDQLKWSSLKVGIVVLIGLAIFVFLIVIVGTEQNIFASRYSLKLFIPNVGGLTSGAMVSLGGLKVGFVGDLQFGMQDGQLGVEVTLDIVRQYRNSITTSSTAQIKTIGLLGDRYVDISIGNPNEQPLAENAFIPIKPSFDLETAGPQLQSALTDFNALLGSAKLIAASIEKGEGSVGRLIKRPTVANEVERFVASLNTIVDGIQQQRGTLGMLLYSDSLSHNISNISGNLRTVTDQIRRGQGTMGKLIMEDRLYSSIASFTARADSLMARASSDTSNVSKLLGDGTFYLQLTTLLRDLDQLLVDIRKNPDRYVKFSVF
jgi:phospholipid/cholesterol/gamma-HCH transport system substrate-binding protein